MLPARLAALSLAAAAGATVSPAGPLAEGGACEAVYPATSASLDYQGGPIMSSVQVVPVMWTSAVDPQIQAWAQGYFTALTSSAYFDLLAQYSTPPVASGGTGQTLGHGTATPPAVITPTVATGNSVDDGDIGPELDAQITAGHVPAPTVDAQGIADTVYVLFFPNGTTIHIGGGSSCSTFCGYHEGHPLTGKLAFTYVVIPDASPGTGCDICGDPCTTGTLPIASAISSVLLAEAVTNPIGTQGWFDVQQQLTIGGLCDTSSSDIVNGTVPGTNLVAHYVWSQKDQRCLIAPATASSSGGSSASSSGGGGNPFGSSSGNPFGSSTGGSSGSGSSGGASSSGGAATTTAGGGCGCAVPGGGATGTGVLALAGLAALRAARRRRRP